MSGPKVFRTITREELVEIAVAQMAVIDLALRRWQAEIADTDGEAAARYQTFQMGRSSIENAVATGRPEEIVRRANMLIASIEHDIDQMRDVAYKREARIKSQQRSLRFMSQSLLDRCRRSGIEIPADQLAILQNSSAGRIKDCNEVARIITHWLQLVHNSEGLDTQSNKQTLARSLMEDAQLESAADCLSRIEREGQDPRVSIVDRQIAELMRLGEIEAAGQFEQRLSQLVSHNNGRGANEFGLFLDSLAMELTTLVKNARIRNVVRRELDAEIAAATATNDAESCQRMFDVAAAEITRGNLEAARKQIQEVHEFLVSRRQSRAAISARTAILKALNQLGYAVQEGMDTSWADSKRLVIQHPTKHGIALELSGSSESGRVQARMVALEGIHRVSQYDRDVESDWCSEVQSLQATLSQSGSRLEIEKAIPAGVHPLKIVDNPWAINEAAIAHKRHREMK